jgi:3-oxoacid CoA-transferase subunit B
MAWTREQIAARATRELKDGYYVNLGIGIPTLIVDHVPDDITVTLHSENGLLGIGPFPAQGEEDADLINAGKQTITEAANSAYFGSATSFAMVRGGHLDVSVLGAMEVAENGDIANWIIPGKSIKGMGGAMDLVANVRRLIVTMEHVSHEGTPKFVERCSLPLTGANAVDVLITDMAVFERPDRRSAFRLVELATGVSLDELRAKTAARFEDA